MADRVAAFHTALLGRRDLSPDLLTTAGVMVVPQADRVGEATASAYVLGEHVVILCDPAVVDLVRPFERRHVDAHAALAAWESFAIDAGAEVLGKGVMRVLVDEPVSVDGVIEIDGRRTDDVSRLTEFVGACSEQEVDHADIDLAALDPIIRCTEAEPGGHLTSYAGAKPWTTLPHLWDIGVLTHPDQRGKGLAVRSVRRLVFDLVAAGNEPFYRHDVDNIASATVADRCGFATAVTLTATRFPRDDRLSR